MARSVRRKQRRRGVGCRRYSTRTRPPLRKVRRPRLSCRCGLGRRETRRSERSSASHLREIPLPDVPVPLPYYHLLSPSCSSITSSSQSPRNGLVADTVRALLIAATTGVRELRRRCQPVWRGQIDFNSSRAIRKLRALIAPTPPTRPCSTARRARRNPSYRLEAPLALALGGKWAAAASGRCAHRGRLRASELSCASSRVAQLRVSPSGGGSR